MNIFPRLINYCQENTAIFYIFFLYIIILQRINSNIYNYIIAL